MILTAFWTKRFSSFTYLNITQFLGALNDNTYKLLIVYFLLRLLGAESSDYVLPLTGAIFVAPFLLFSASSGTLADRCSKRNIIVLTKVFELLIMAFGVLSFAFQSQFGAYATLFFMATQSAIFGPSKYGIIPEIVGNEKLSQANGLMTSFTFLAIIIGTFLASFITQITGYDFVLAALLCTGIALLGIVTSFGIEYTPPSGSSKRFDILFIREVVRALKLAAEEPSLLPAIMGSTYFLFIGACIQLNMIPYAMECLNLSEVQGGYLFLLAALGIGTGSMIAGKLSGKSVEMGLVPVSALFIAILFFFVDYFSTNLPVILVMIVILGMFGGIFQVPLDSYIQYASPSQNRGQIIAAANFTSFGGVLIASAFLFICSYSFQIRSDTIFSILGIITLVVGGAFCFQFFEYTTRFIAMVLARVHFKTIFEGVDNIPSDAPAIYVCHHTAWNDTLLLLGSQRRRVRFFIEQEQEHKNWIKKLYNTLRIIKIQSTDDLKSQAETVEHIEKTLNKGISICIFVESQNVASEVKKLRQSSIFAERDIPIISVSISKGKKTQQTRFFTQLFSKIRVPAIIRFG